MIKLDEAVTEKAWILMDGAVFDAPRFIYEHDDQPALEYLYLGTLHESVIEVSPCLVKPSSLSRIWTKQETWQSNAVVLMTGASMPVLADHLRSLLSVRLPDGAYAYLRFYSPKQLCRLMDAFTDRERDRFSGPITNWFALESAGPWRQFSADGGVQAQHSRDEGWFALADHHVASLETGARADFVSRLARYLSVNDPVRLEALIQQANSFGFRTEKDVSRYAELAVVHGNRIKDSELQALLSSTEIPAVKRLNEVDKRLAYGVAS
ncbi:MAG: hypothetical protein B7X58_13635 [Marinobacter sp. 34-60-7]|nr:MAG: hypothetical protein B7X58_13635 [Marinobacter sp. 34-60-7]